MQYNSELKHFISEGGWHACKIIIHPISNGNIDLFSTHL